MESNASSPQLQYRQPNKIYAVAILSFDHVYSIIIDIYLVLKNLHQFTQIINNNFNNKISGATKR